MIAENKQKEEEEVMKDNISRAEREKKNKDLEKRRVLE